MWIAISLTIITITLGKLYLDRSFKKLLRRNQELTANLITQKDEYHKLYNVVMLEVEEMHNIINKSALKADENDVTFATPPSVAAQSLEEIDGILSKLETYIAKASVI
jgi:hypothetical protein